ncbi:MAG: endolytic transglycosylase MltG [Clostridiales bacterium]|nr:endolytic transglycosylase MltG [Clostridiales bacterium]
MILTSSVLLILSGCLWAWDYVDSNYLKPVDADDHTPVVVDIESRSTVSTIARILEENGIIRNKSVFKYYVDLMGYGSKLKAGTYILNRQMSIYEIMEKLARGEGKAKVMKFLVIEGMTIEAMAESLVQQKAIDSKDEFLSLCRDGDSFMKYAAISDIDTPENENRKYLLEGYLFPATYEIYVDSSEETVIEKMLNKFTLVMKQEYIERAEQLNMTVDQVITLASMIEREGKTSDFARISAVFHNRMNDEMRLESDATVQYALGIRKLYLTDEEIKIDSPYNTYKIDGLPIGPICSPSQKAIEAALYPDETTMSEGYYYFATKDPMSGELNFSKTLEEHEAAVEQYRPLWKAYDEGQYDELNQQP